MLQVTNKFDAVDAKILSVYFSTCDRTANSACVFDQARKNYFDGKQIMLLTNTQYIDYNQEVIS